MREDPKARLKFLANQTLSACLADTSGDGASGLHLALIAGMIRTRAAAAPPYGVQPDVYARFVAKAGAFSDPSAQRTARAALAPELMADCRLLIAGLAAPQPSLFDQRKDVFG